MNRLQPGAYTITPWDQPIRPGLPTQLRAELFAAWPEWRLSRQLVAVAEAAAQASERAVVGGVEDQAPHSLRLDGMNAVHPLVSLGRRLKRFAKRRAAPAPVDPEGLA